LASEFHIFREARRVTAIGNLIARLRGQLQQLQYAPCTDNFVSGLLLAGELECALVDAGSSEAASAAAITDELAKSVTDCDAGLAEDAPLIAHCQQLLGRITFDGQVSVSTPEGFAYYVLHPLDYADVISRVEFVGSRALVVGLRTIGTTLSAVVAAQLKRAGVVSERFTVRPAGHPYERVCTFTSTQCESIAGAQVQGAQFVVCDEGPGRSGSSLLSVAEALEREGVPAARVVMICSHQPDVDGLCTPNAARRWLRFRSIATGMAGRLPAGANVYAGGGEWRGRLLSRESDWPPAWPQMERLKYLSDDSHTVFTFEGYGPYGAEVRQRNQRLSDSQFGAEYLGHETGFGKHHLGNGSLVRPIDLTPQLVRHMARYCAWRAREFAAPNLDSAQLQDMAVTNLLREFGNSPAELLLHVERPTICDNRMAPHHWLIAGGSWHKLDASIHGDDHFFPGLCDIAWDLAGVIVEWDLQAEARDVFLAEYRRASGDDTNPRVHDYEIAYAMFRLAWCRMAAASVVGSEEEQRLTRDAGRYRSLLDRILTSRCEVTRPVLSSLTPV
jgi:hypothetical protein